MGLKHIGASPLWAEGMCSSAGPGEPLSAVQQAVIDPKVLGLERQ